MICLPWSQSGCSPRPSLVRIGGPLRYQIAAERSRLACRKGVADRLAREFGVRGGPPRRWPPPPPLEPPETVASVDRPAGDVNQRLEERKVPEVDATGYTLALKNTTAVVARVCDTIDRIGS